MTGLTPKQRQLLVSISNHGGSLQGKDLHASEKSMASRMQGKDLLRWAAPKDATLRKNLDNWAIHITEAGRNALK